MALQWFEMCFSPKFLGETDKRQWFFLYWQKYTFTSLDLTYKPSRFRPSPHLTPLPPTNLSNDTKFRTIISGFFYYN